jgi:hypothetical protein
MRLFVLLVHVIFTTLGYAQSVQYGSQNELCGTKLLFVDSGLYLEGRNNIVSIVEATQLPGLKTAASLEEADVLIKLTDRGSGNWAPRRVLQASVSRGVDKRSGQSDARGQDRGGGTASVEEGEVFDPKKLTMQAT